MIIKSILDNDLYKFTMQNAVLNLFPRAKVRYKFINRDPERLFPEGFDKLLREEVQKMKDLALTKEELEFFKKSAYYLPPTYFDFLAGYRFNPDEVKISLENGHLRINIEGYWYRTILWEVPLMAIISELYFKVVKSKTYSQEKIIEIVKEKADLYNRLGVKVADFGTRRRYSFENHDLVVKILKDFGKPAFVGTSNVFLAYKYNLVPIGTHAHEWFMFHAAKFGYKMANKLALENWVKVYRGDLGIALSDTFTTEAFFRAFDKKLAKLFDGVRQDSGDPIEFANKMINHYRNLGIDPKSKVIIFSDSLTPEKVKEIAVCCKDKIKISFGIGTNFTNDVGVKPLNIVIKMSEAKPEGWDWVEVVKLSDARGKYTGSNKLIEMVKDILQIR